MSTCQHLVLIKISHQVKYFRLPDLEARRRAKSLAEADVKGD